MSMEYFKTSEILSNAKIDGGLRKKGIFKKNKKDQPLLTIITAVLNNEKYLEESITSLQNQKYKNYEHIIIDGGSTDRTVDIIKKYEDRIDYWCSEKDKGIYDAFNKGMKLASGQYIGFLNSDDSYSDNAFEILTKYIKINSDKDFIFGAVKKHWGVLYGYKPYKIYWSWGFYSSHSTGFFIKTESAKKVGLYNLKYKFSADYDYFFRMIVKEKLKGIATKKNEIFGTFRRGGYSSTINFFDHFMEEIKIRLNNGQNKILVLMIFIYKYIKNISKI
jgi:glycosyltransferase involved in cell wall biosynthesis